MNVVQYHPVPVKCCGKFVLFENAFGKCVSGTDPTANSIQSTTVNFKQSKITVDDFYKIENLGISSSPKFGNCKCGQCGLEASVFSIKDKRELELIHNGLSLENKVWTARYPWIKNPSDLPNNKLIAAKMLQNTEKRLLKDEKKAETYQSQIQDMLDRGVAKKLDVEDLNYDGPVHYISHHEVLKQDSASTPCRIVFIASANYKNHVLNDYWAKSPDLLGNLLGLHW